MTDQAINLIEDDQHRQNQIFRLLRSLGEYCRVYASFREFDYAHNISGVILLSNYWHQSILKNVLASLKSRDEWSPIVLYSATPRSDEVVEAIFAGAVDYIEWPFREPELEAVLCRARLKGRAIEDGRKNRAKYLHLLSYLSKREAEVLAKIVLGLSSKEIAIDLELSYRTVEQHRINISKKLKARNIAEIVKIALSGEKVIFPPDEDRAIA